jgi:hypothetical protein
MKKRTQFIQDWLTLLWNAMGKSGHGYRLGSFRWSAGDQRRPDKTEFKGPQFMRRYRDRYHGMGS